MTTEHFTVPMVHKLTHQRLSIDVQATSPKHAIEVAQELYPGWAAQFPIRRREEWS